MRDLRALAVLCALGLAGAPPVRAQTPDQPNLMFTISGGLTVGSGALWTVPRQLAFASNNGVQNLWDSVGLSRKLGVGFLATLTATYFRSPHLGYTLEAGFFGLETKGGCAALGPFTPVSAAPPNAQACGYLQGQDMRGDVVGLLAGVTYRATSGGVQPYVRASAGGALVGSSFVEMAAPTLQQGGTISTVYFLADQNHTELTWMASVGVGVMLPLGPGYQLLVEARDLIVSLPYPSGPATDTGAVAAGSQLPQPPVARKVVLVPTIAVGLDIVLERRRGRRY